MVGHLLRYHPAFARLEAMVASGSLGRLRHLYASRLSLGRIRPGESVLWSFAPHDVSMVLALVGEEPHTVVAVGGEGLDGRSPGITTSLAFPGGARAQVLVSWLHPFKEQRLVVVGDRAMAVLDDRRPWSSKLVVHPHAVDWADRWPEPLPADACPVAVDELEPLVAECAHFLACIDSGAAPRTDGREGLRVLRVLEAAERAVSSGTAPAAPEGVFVHPTAEIDQPATVGEGTRIWHFSHVLAGTTIGRDCTVGQNVMIGPNVSVGDRCKMQNNVSVYEGVTLADGVFCGPSCVFTNVAEPRAEIDRTGERRPTRVGRGATIGANATIVCGHDIGDWSFVAAGAVVTSDVPPHALVAGVPARRIGWVGHEGVRLGDDLVCPRSGRRYVLRGPDQLEELPPGGDGALVAPAAPPVEMVDLRAQRRRLGRRVERSVARVLDHGRFVLGPEVDRLEARLAARGGVAHAVTCASGTDALLLALLAEEVESGDAVFVPAFTFAATAEAVALAGATPVFVDVRPDTFTIDAASLAEAVRATEDAGLRPVGVIPVDLFGQPADYPAVGKVAADAGLWVTADAAQSLGASLDGRSVGSLAGMTATSFFPSKPLGCYGDGGAVLTDDDALAARLRSLRAHGTEGGRSDNVRLGLNSRLDTLQAAVLLEKLIVFDDELDARRAVAEEYGRELAAVVRTPVLAPGATSVWAQYTVRSPARGALAARLRAEGVATAVHYPTPLPRRPAFARFPVAPGGLAVSEQLCTEVLSLPLHPYLDRAARRQVVAGVHDALAG